MGGWDLLAEGGGKVSVKWRKSVGELLTEGGGQGECVKWRKGVRWGVGNY